MTKDIEHRIRFKAVIIYVIVASVVIAMTIYLNNLRKNILSQRIEIENQHTLLSVTNDLMFSVSEAQSSASLYLSTNNQKYFNKYIKFIDTIEELIDSIIKIKPNSEEKLCRIETLLQEQAQNITELNLEFAEKNPIANIRERLQAYSPDLREDTLSAVNVRSDTVLNESSHKGLFRRISEVFKPSKDSSKIVVIQRVDTIKRTVNDSLIIHEVSDITRKAHEKYEQYIMRIEKQVGELMIYDKEIAGEVSALLLEFHKETLDSSLSMIDAGENAVKRNYIYSTIGGVFALVLILIFIILIITDINQGRKARLALEAANERTRQTMESRHQLLLAVSHDIKSPLNSILGYLALMKNEPNVHSMQNSSEHILSMLENLLEFSNLEQGALQKSISDFNLRDLFEDIYEMFLPLANQKTLAFTFTADNIRIRTDRVKLKQIVINLVSNAIKYTKTGSVSLETTFDKNELIIEVNDTGAGIPDEKLSEIFKPFIRIEENNALAAGTGLGMYVVKGLAELLGGEISILSEVGSGTTAIITIPAEHSLNEIPRGTKRITIYDDDPVIVKMLSDMLLRLGHQVVDTDCNLILTDMEMGDISGFEILHNAGSVPVVVMTGRADFSTEKAKELGFDGFLAKPFTIESLREIAGEGEILDELLGDNRDEIMALFRVSIEENFSKLKQALADNNFKQAQYACHKMFPMFAQTGLPTEELRKMDAHRNNEYEVWREDVEKILSIKV